MDKNFVVIVNIEFPEVMILTDFLGVVETSGAAFRKIEEYDYLKVISEEYTYPVNFENHRVLKDMYVDEHNKLRYSEVHYLCNDGLSRSTKIEASVYFHIFQV